MVDPVFLTAVPSGGDKGSEYFYTFDKPNIGNIDIGPAAHA
jgi:hypothetical protein